LFESLKSIALVLAVKLSGRIASPNLTFLIDMRPKVPTPRMASFWMSKSLRLERKYWRYPELEYIGIVSS
jgi:hypothetical protein